ncbi:MAG TPA: tetratricopeptide repeat protein [Methylophilaceae bacterium]|nr:tetratricopeptide repeat protein [Methylophilaceae bacterium]HQR60539.1 tetratricopeptide repeat protein [Methylophilaceae bacterium]
MAYDLEEQEQLDELKAWWKRHGNTVMLGLGLALAAFAAYQGWKAYQHRQSLQASAQYDALTQLEEKDIKGIRSISGQIIEKYAGTPYAVRAALIAAKANYAANDAKSAKAQLEWAMGHAKEDALRAVAQLQLAAIQFDEKQYDAALKTLGEKHDAGFDGLFADLKGDILAAQGKKAEAKAAYAEALTKLDAGGDYRHHTEHKLDALGS